mmetsp:Transcript_28747/g.54294  ORF Transcript_28747/g.54294 Transcript_28747/m.54294 type:complete len:215 (-) Transcript_28747:135-779(-)|eukprot:CAMPEP_0201674342 /NCGR_PEP_ID=MMETSP0494-20130426/36821_1 /ASSEMBLY_ACC=CAM_ASM_000839 /TAXON_ID=420259 /ORGANISM="Thalassiosira gravida, Strain GMp14c1" /LENGTH=214 /DNA_ID=CAMNT_0048156469 /DNA_START=190 /DNA_END=834 /DNA_ORIENTATION=+
MDHQRTNGYDNITQCKAVRFADLPRSACSSTTTCRPTRPASINRRCRRHVRSAPISLPKTHIHRTPSEIQLADDTLYAECKDVEMYSRLMTGMLHQIQHRGNDVDDMHPLMKKSMEGIIRTMELNDHELEHHHECDDHDDDGWDKNSYLSNHHGSDQHDNNDDDDNGWDMYSYIDEESVHSSTDSSSRSGQSLNDSLYEIADDVEDDCIFSLEI